ncbi:splicing factor U2af large subunit A-like [Paramuricea clavata]|uniref:Splicing factor U2af large subunit A-like n=1 Tax=Paramuricea clavata TaxID=317549 RepID=A0A6S7G429_PARCT|nr:splicing factor U2af large subunit A-like [Paramuricea clavata]
MSTYSWSYRTAVHRQVSAKRVKTDQESPDKNEVCQIESDKVVLHSSSSQNNDAAGIVTPKRLHWRAKIYFGNLNKKTNEASLAYYFSVFGDIEDVKLIRDHDTKESRGFAFITFEKIEAAEKAKKWCSFNYPSLDDNNITVASAERKTHKIKISKKDERAKRHPSQTLFWEFKWTDTNEAQVYGPYETSLMQAWKNQGYFDRGCWVRQVLHRQISRAGEKHEVQANTSEVTRAEDLQNAANVNTFEGNSKDESCEARPCKKPKLVIEYSDSEDEGDHDDDEECGDDKEECRDDEEGCGDDDEKECGGISDADGRSANILPRYESEHLKLKIKENEHLQLHESKDKLDSVVEVKQDERTSSSEQYEGEHLRLSENEKQDNSSLSKEHLQPSESDLLTFKMKQRDGESLGLANDEGKKGVVNETTLKHIDRENGESVREEIHAVKMHNNILEQHEHQVQTQEVSQQKQNTSSEDNLRSGAHEQSIPNKVGENLDILQMYEQGSSVLSEYDERDERLINDEDLRRSDDSSSGEEDIENDDDDDISTEFVAISEIDFNFYP